MHKKEHQQWPDGAQVRFTEEARDAMNASDANRGALRSPKLGTDRTYTIKNTDDSHHDVILVETGERYGTYWLQGASELLSEALMSEISATGTLFTEGDLAGFVIGSYGPQTGNTTRLEGHRWVDGKRYYVEARLEITVDTYIKSELDGDL